MESTQQTISSPISTLPDEILCEIFVQARDAFWEDVWPELWSPSLLYRSSWLNVTSVCTHWRRVSNTPRFWNGLRLRNKHRPSDKDALDQLLNRSESALLDVDLRSLRGNADYIYDGLVPHWNRIHRLYVYGWNFPQSFVDALETADVSQLVHFTMCSYTPRSQPNILPSDGFRSGAPRLRTLHLFNGTLSCEIPHLRHLTSLVTHPNITSTLLSSILIPTLQNAPRIEKLEVSGLTVDAELSSVSLPFVTELSISSSDSRSASLFNFLEYPSSAIVSYARDDFREEEELDVSGIASVYAKFASDADSSVNQVSLSLAHGSCTLALFTDHPIWSSSPRISISFASEDEDLNLFTVLSQLCDVLPHTNFAGLSLRGFPIEWNLNQSLFLQRFSGVEVLNLVECPAGVFVGLKGNYQRPTPLPQLRTILLKDCTIDEEFFDALSCLLTYRISVKNPVETLYVGCCMIKEESYIKELAELVVVEWDEESWNSDLDDDLSYVDSDGSSLDDDVDRSDTASDCHVSVNHERDSKCL
ncbi:hypothetical protein ONZ45_g11945 [Pleurotus djamor]|nr:hypothetical protein ONZ45_g11945 [Pleurotus djamor]